MSEGGRLVCFVSVIVSKTDKTIKEGDSDTLVEDQERREKGHQRETTTVEERGGLLMLQWTTQLLENSVDCDCRGKEGSGGLAINHPIK